ncbi:hypothetical protein Gpo141_00007091 [Globisporangium polare]
MTMSASVASGTGNGSSGNARRYIVFDGSTDFNLWRARLENELLRFHLLGYILVKDYDGSQSFVYNNEEIPPKCAMVDDDDEQVEQQQTDPRTASTGGVRIKDEPNQTSNNFTGRKRTRGALGMRPGRLSRLKVIEERAEAMSILQRYLHPEVERAILGKNIYDSWATLCGMYGNRNVSDFYTVHRLLHAMKLGEKDESAQDFIARLELMMEQYAQIAGIQLTDPFRSMMLANALPEDWAALLNVWKAFKPYIPYLQLVEKVTFEFSSRLVLKERELTIAQGTPRVEKEKKSTSTSHAPKKTLQLGVDSTAAKKSDTPAHASASSKQSPSSSSVCKPAAKSVPENPKTSSRAEDKDKHEDKSSSSAKPRADEKKRSEKESSSSHCGKRDDKYDAAKRVDKYDDAKWVDKYESSKRVDDKYYDKKRDDKREDHREKDLDDRRDYNKNNGHANEKRNVCYYCLKLGHSFRACWFLRVDIENDSIVNNHKKYSATVTNERSAYMVYRIEQYAREVRQEKSSSTDRDMLKPPSRSYTDQARMRSKSSFREEHTVSYSQSNHHHHHHLGSSHDSRILEPPKTPSRSYMTYSEIQDPRMAEPPKTPSRSYSEIASMRSKSMYRESAPQQQQSYRYAQSVENHLDSDVDRYKKRSRSVYGGGDLDLTMKTRPRDPRSRSVFRQSEESGAHESRSRSTAEHAASRRSVSPIPNNIHRGYSRDSRAY